MENPRKRVSKDNADRTRGQVVDLKSYRNRRRKLTLRSTNHPSNQRYTWLRALAIGLTVATVVFAIVGLFPLHARSACLVWAIFTGTLGFICGLSLYVLRVRDASKILVYQAFSFVFAYICALLAGHI